MEAAIPWCYLRFARVYSQLKDVNSGASMLLGPTMDSMRSASVMKNLRTLHLRIKQHSHNAAYLAERFEKDGLKTVYPGLQSHPSQIVCVNDKSRIRWNDDIDVGLERPMP
jgi:cystathionine beta-lyase/cystathionine gamma-synthase